SSARSISSLAKPSATNWATSAPKSRRCISGAKTVSKWAIRRICSTSSRGCSRASRSTRCSGSQRRGSYANVTAAATRSVRHRRSRLATLRTETPAANTSSRQADGVAKMKAALYARFSTDLQRAASIEDQFRNCRKRAELEGWTVVATFADAAMSGSDANRPQYRAMLEAATRREFDVLMVDDLSRLTRDAVECERAIRRLEFA